MAHSIEVPETITKSSVYSGIAFLFFLSFLLLYVIFPFTWAGIVAIVIFGIVTMSGVVAEDVDDWHGAIVFNHWARTRRVMFAGFHWKLPWESPEELHSLKREVSSEGVENLATNDPAEKMDVSLLIHIRLDTSGSPEEAAKKFVRFNSVEDHHLNTIIRTEVLNLFGQYYGKCEMEALTKLVEIQKAVLEDPDASQRMGELQEKYGCHIGVVLKKSVPDEVTRQYKTTPARAEALKTALETLKSAGLNEEQARKAALLLDPNADFTETHTDWDVKLDAPDLKNLRNFSMIPPNMLGSGKKGTKK